MNCFIVVDTLWERLDDHYFTNHHLIANYNHTPGNSRLQIFILIIFSVSQNNYERTQYLFISIKTHIHGTSMLSLSIYVVTIRNMTICRERTIRTFPYEQFKPTSTVFMILQRYSVNMLIVLSKETSQIERNSDK